jgi:prefoldin subunit 5
LVTFSELVSILGITNFFLFLKKEQKTMTTDMQLVSALKAYDTKVMEYETALKNYQQAIANLQSSPGKFDATAQGSVVQGATTLLQCQWACVADPTTCNGITFDNPSKQCKKYSSWASVDKTTPVTSVYMDLSDVQAKYAIVVGIADELKSQLNTIQSLGLQPDEILKQQAVLQKQLQDIQYNHESLTSSRLFVNSQNLQLKLYALLSLFFLVLLLFLWFQVPFSTATLLWLGLSFTLLSCLVFSWWMLFFVVLLLALVVKQFVI